MTYSASPLPFNCAGQYIKFTLVKIDRFFSFRSRTNRYFINGTTITCYVSIMYKSTVLHCIAVYLIIVIMALIILHHRDRYRRSNIIILYRCINRNNIHRGYDGGGRNYCNFFFFIIIIFGSNTHHRLPSVRSS